jgi:CheY-like chemotaxis protein
VTRVVLLVDDDPFVRRLLRLTLPVEGYEVVESAGDDALELAGACRPALVLLDWRLPGSSGAEVLRALKQRWPLLPVIVLTAEQAPGERRLAFELGADRYVTKPFSPLELIEAVERLLEAA